MEGPRNRGGAARRTHDAIFTADEVWQRLEILNQAEGANPKALGAVLSSLARDGVIETTGNYRKSVLPRRHQRPVAEWRLT